MSEPGQPAPAASQFSLRHLLKSEWPYLLVLVLALFGIAFTSYQRGPMAAYWIVLATLIGAICIASRWHEIGGRDERMHLVWKLVWHWAGVVLAMHVMFVDVDARRMNSDASALAVLTLLALGTFTAGVHIGSWRISLVGAILAIGVPGIAWLEQSALLLLVAALVVIAVLAPLLWRERQMKEKTSVGAATGP